MDMRRVIAGVIAQGDVAAGASLSVTFNDYFYYPQPGTLWQSYGEALSLGDAASDRIVVVSVTIGGGGYASDASSVDIGGTTATKAVQVSASLNYGDASIWYAEIATGTSATITVTKSDSRNDNMVVSCFSIYNATSATPVDTDSTYNNTSSDTSPEQSVTLSYTGDGVAIAAYRAGAADGDDDTGSFTLINKDVDVASSGHMAGSGVTASGTITGTQTSDTSVRRLGMCGAAWQ